MSQRIGFVCRLHITGLYPQWVGWQNCRWTWCGKGQGFLGHNVQKIRVLSPQPNPDLIWCVYTYWEDCISLKAISKGFWWTVLLFLCGLLVTARKINKKVAPFASILIKKYVELWICAPKSSQRVTFNLLSFPSGRESVNIWQGKNHWRLSK